MNDTPGSSIAEYHHRYYLEHKDKWIKFRREHPEAHSIANKKSYHKLRPIRGSADNKRRNELRRELRDEVLSHYGGTPPVCACCGEDQREFLAIDHINGGGRKHVASISGKHLVSWIRANGYPPGFRVLCHNCNFALGFYGHCPHDARQEVPNR